MAFMVLDCSRRFKKVQENVASFKKVHEGSRRLKRLKKAQEVQEGAGKFRKT